MFAGKYHGDYITKLTPHGFKAIAPHGLKDIRELVLFENKQDVTAKLPYYAEDIQLVKVETVKKYMEARYIIGFNGPTMRFVLKKAPRKIRTTYSPEAAIRFSTKREAEKYIATLHPIEKITFYVTDRLQRGV